MKALIKTSLLAIGISALALPGLNAAATADNVPAPSAPTVPAHHAGLLRRAAIRHHLAKQLGLTPEQVAQLRANRTNTAAAMKAIREDTSLTPDEKKAKIRETRQAGRTQMRGVLTPDQQAKLDQLRSQWREAHGQ